MYTIWAVELYPYSTPAHILTVPGWGLEKGRRMIIYVITQCRTRHEFHSDSFTQYTMCFEFVYGAIHSYMTSTRRGDVI